ncbi:MAG TPA: RNA polymerase sigma factor [Alphaproteobacteria bacterium]
MDGNTVEASAGTSIDGTSIDAQLVRRAQAGETLAFEQIMRRFNRRLFRVAYSITKDVDEAEDVVQEAYVRAFTAIGDLIDATRLSTWLVTIAVNEARGRLRRGQRYLPLDDADRQEDADGETEPMPMFTVPATSPEHLAHSSELRRILEAAIDALPASFRTVFMLRAVEQLSVDETAECLGIPAATVKTRFHRARTQLRRALEAQSRDLMPELYPFDGTRCDRIIAQVRMRLGLAPP